MSADPRDAPRVLRARPLHLVGRRADDGAPRDERGRVDDRASPGLREEAALRREPGDVGRPGRRDRRPRLLAEARDATRLARVLRRLGVVVREGAVLVDDDPDRDDRPEVARRRRVDVGEVDADAIVGVPRLARGDGVPSAMYVFALSDLALGRIPASATSSSSWLVGSLSGPETRGANAGPPTTEPRKTTFTQSRSVKA